MRRCHCPTCGTLFNLIVNSQKVGTCPVCSAQIHAAAVRADKPKNRKPTPAPTHSQPTGICPPPEATQGPVRTGEDGAYNLAPVQPTREECGPCTTGSPGAGKRRRRPRQPIQKNRDGFSFVEAIPLDYTLQVNLGTGIGLVLHLLGAFMLQSTLGMSLIFVGLFFFYWGCAAYAKNKGYGEAFGLLGLLGLLGLIVLIYLPDRPWQDSP